MNSLETETESDFSVNEASISETEHDEIPLSLVPVKPCKKKCNMFHELLINI